ncbi:MAG TPA: flavodoxin-dependent (E)-4-hydroxy-3-methylbut-2-enyl-diphosphate synthase [Acidobacteriota bacterium]|nr:flavodoxin-dependent (E)-4-hydroxy-3-methylbut-2-enyl-diphosphate synthase [Acidobacteriota bacterium]
MPARVEFARRNTRSVCVGNLKIGGDAPVSVQSMTKTDTRDVDSTLRQISTLEESGCELVRCAVPDSEAAESLREIVAGAGIPVAADIHFDSDLALASLKAGVAKLRINPGTIGDREKVERLAREAKERGVPIRIGVNAGSLEREYLKRDGWPSPEGMVDSALGHIRLLEGWDFTDIVVSLKASDVSRTVAAYRLLAGRCDYPFHLGITEAGAGENAVVKSAAGIGALLAEGIGDTIRVSLTEDPVREVEVGWAILKSLGLRKKGPEFISCPTCGRCEVDISAIAAEVERRLKGISAPITVAVMGCAVNGPGEAREADIGFAAGREKGAIFRRGELLRTISVERAVEELVAEALKLADDIDASSD